MFLDHVKCLLACWCLFELLIFLYDFRKWVCNLAEVLNEASVIVHKTDECLYFFNGLRLRLFLDCSYLGWFYSDLAWLDDVSEEFYFFRMEIALFWVNK